MTAIPSRVIPTQLNGVLDDSVTLWVLKNGAEMILLSEVECYLKDTLLVERLSTPGTLEHLPYLQE